MKRFLCALLVSAMLFSSVDLTAIATETNVSGNDLIESEPETEEVETEEIETEEEIPVEAATEEVTSGQCGDNLYWDLTDGVLTISGTGDMWDYAHKWDLNPNPSPWQGNLAIKQIIFPEGITHIGAFAFTECKNCVGKLVIPDGVTSIGKGAFSDCGFTGDLELPDSITYIDEIAFTACKFDGILKLPSNLKTVRQSAFSNNHFAGDLVLPEGLEKLEPAFSNCSFSGRLVLPKDMTYIEDGAFSGSSFTGELKFPDGLVSIGHSAFRACIGFTGDLEFPEGLISIGREAFAWCDCFDGELKIPNSVTTIWKEAFLGCSGFTGDLKIPESLTNLETAVFGGCSGFDGELKLPEGLINIRSQVFAECSGLTGKLMIPDSVQTIGIDSFAFCTGLTGKLELPENLTAIGSGAFYECTGLTGALAIPDSVTTIGEEAFELCTGLNGIICVPSSVASIGANAFNLGDGKVITIYGEVGSYAETYASQCGINFVPYGSGAGNVTLEDIMNADYIYVHVIDADLNIPIPNAVINGVTSDHNGFAGVLVLNFNDDYSFNVTADGYNTVTDMKNVEPNGTYYISMKPTDGKFDIVYAQTTLDGSVKNVLTRNLCLQGVSEGFDEISGKVDMDLEVKARGDIVKYELFQGDTLKYTSTDGHFKIPVKLKGIDDRPLTGLEGNKMVSVKATNKEGEEVSKVIGIRVAPEECTIPEEEKKGSIEIGSNIKFTVPEDNPWLGGKELSFGLGLPMPVELEIKEDGHIKVAINKKDAVSFNDHKEEYEKLAGRAQQLADAAKTFGGTPETFGGGCLSFGVSVSGYGEGYIDMTKPGHTEFKVGIVITGKGSSTYSQYVWAGWVPFTLSIKAGGEISADISGKVIYQDRKYSFAGDTTIKAKIYLEPRAAVGIDNIVSLGVKGNAALNYSAELSNGHQKVWLSAYLAVYGTLFFMEGDVFKTDEAEEILWESPAQTNQIMATESLLTEDITRKLYDSHSYKLMDRSYLLQKENTLSPSETDHTLIQSAVYPGASPKLVEAGNKLYLFWLQDIADRSSENRSALVYAISEDGKTWSEPVQVIPEEENCTADNGFDLFVQDNTIYVCWQDAGVEYEPGISIEQAMQQLHIAYAVIDGISGEAVSHEIVTSEMGCYLLPRISVVNNRVEITWVANRMAEGAGVFDKGNTQKLVKWNSQSGEYTELSIGNAQEKIVSIDATVEDTKQGVIYVLDKDGDFVTAGDREVYYDIRQQETETAKQLLASSTGSMANVVAENGYCYWYADGNIYYAPVGSSQVSMVFEAASEGAPGSFAVAESDGKTSILWTGIEQETGNVLIHGVTGEGHANWSVPYVLEKTDSEMTGDLSAVYHNGQLQATYLHVKDTSDGSRIRSIYTFAEKERKDVALTYAFYDNEECKQGSVLPITVGLVNKGNTAIETVEVKWDDISLGTKTINLGVGETKEIILENYTVPETLTGYEEHMLSVEASGESELSDNKYSLGVGYTDVSLVCNSRLQNENTWLDISVLNKSSIDTNCILNIRANEDEGTILYTENLGTVKSGQGVSMTVNLEEYQSEYCTYFVEVVTDVPDMIEGNNLEFIYTGFGTDIPGGNLVTEAKKYTVTFDSNGGSSVESKKVVENTPVLEPGIPYREGYHFEGWYLDGTLYDFAQPVTSDITLVAQWREYETLAAPSANIASESGVEPGTKIVLTCAATGADIYYTLDGTVPTKESLRYESPIIVVEDAVITAIAVMEGYKNSVPVTFRYHMLYTESSTFTVAFQSNGGTEIEKQQVERNICAVKPADPVKEGYVFEGWYLNERLFDFSTPITRSIILEAKWSMELVPDDIPEDGNIPEGLWVAEVKDQPYTGKAIKPEIHVYDGSRRLQEKTDYTVSYKNNTKANDAFDPRKAPTITVTGKGNYTGKDTKTFKILQQDIGASEVQCSDIILAYNSKKEQKPVPVLTFNGKKLKNKTDFTLDYPDATEENPGAYKEPGTYRILVKGINNFKLERTVYVTITENRLVSKLKVSKIPNQPYTGDEVTPPLVVKYGSETLQEKIHYDVTYTNNVEIGTATATITGLDNYLGEKTVTFKITGTSISKAKAENLPTSVTYKGSEWRPEYQLTITQDNVKRTLKEGKNYTVTWQNNVQAGRATVIFTGINDFTGTMKKTFKITPYDMKLDTENKISVEEGIVIAHVKGGSKPEPIVTYDGKVLTLGKDYTLKYSNNKAVNYGENANKVPTITVTGKGNFKGSVAVPFKIRLQDIGLLQMTVADKAVQTKPNKYQSVPKITDLDGKTLKAGTDYEKALEYTYGEETLLADGTVRREGEKIQATDILPINTLVKVTATGKGNYRSDKTLSGTYRIIEATKDISKAKVVIKPQPYTGYAVEPGKDKIQITMKGVDVPQENYEIVDYSNNVKKGTATIILQGVGKNYGGTKKATFKIQAKGMTWWEKVVSFF